jgi:hypothetical protein
MDLGANRRPSTTPTSATIVALVSATNRGPPIPSSSVPTESCVTLSGVNREASHWGLPGPTALHRLQLALS